LAKDSSKLSNADVREPVAIRCGFPRRELNTFGAVEATRKMERGPVAHSRNKMFANDDRLILIVLP
jgi:hypothetical protein